MIKAESSSSASPFLFFLSVPPIIIGLNPDRVNVVVNNFASLSCEATGFPPPTLSWLNDRGPVQTNTNTLIVPGMVSGGNLMWTPFFLNNLNHPDRVFLVCLEVAVRFKL